MSVDWQIEQSLPTVAVRRLYVEIGGDLVVGTLLSQIAYWFRPTAVGSKLRVVREGRSWLAKTRAQWFEETGITEKQYSRAIKVLQELGLVEVRMWRFAGLVVPHIWLNVERLHQLVRSSQKVATGRTERDRPYTETTAETTDAYASAEARAVPTKVVGLSEGYKMKASQVLQAHKDKEKPLPKAATHSMCMLWKQRMSLLYNSGFVRELTAKEVGQMKKVVQALGESAPSAVDWALQHWTTFTIHAKKAKGLTVTPDQPVLGFLLAHHELLASAMQPIAPPVVKPKVVLSAPVEATAPTAPKDDKMTLEQLMELEPEFGGGQ